MTLPLSIIENAWRALENGTLKEFLSNYPETANIIRAAVIPSIAIANKETMITGGVPLVDPERAPHNTTWKAHKAWLEASGNLPEKAIIDLESSTAEVADVLANPELDKVYGLVVGYVQSGKTAHFSGLMARAADLGYTFVIVLSGILNDLRSQGQRRLIRDIIGQHHHELAGEESIPVEGRKLWQLLTTVDGDIKREHRDGMPEIMMESIAADRILIAVVKKNVNVLEHLMNGIKSTDLDILSKHRVLIIDDEADHASVNTGGDGSEHEDESFVFQDEDEDDPTSSETDPSKTNMMVRRIIQCFEKVAYVGYTATPFANVLIDPEEGRGDPIHGLSLYPRHFIKCLKRPDGYFGPDIFFGDLEDPEQDTPYTISLKPIEYEPVLEMEPDIDREIEDLVPHALQNALMDFILTGIVRSNRRNLGIEMNVHHTMLIHITHRNRVQEDIHELVEDLLENWKTVSSSTFDAGTKFRKRLRDRWESEFMAQSKELETWSGIESELLKDEDEEGWIHSVKIRMINSLTKETLDYDQFPDGLNVIAIGGNKLSRGLTLEGLCISFFIRHTRLYDTLMQMGRWFGFRHGYEDLVRVHTSEKLLTWFSWLVMVEREVRMDIHQYKTEGTSPLDLAVRIPLHQEMRPTGSGKMKSAVTTIADYNGRTVQSIRLPIDEPARLEANLNLTTGFINSLGEPVDKTNRMAYWKEVDSSAIADYVAGLDLVGPPLAVFDTSGIAKFIRTEMSDKKFVVAHPGNPYHQLSQAPDEPPNIDPQWNVNRLYIARSQLCDSAGQPKEPPDIRAVADPQDMRKIEHVQEGDPAIVIYLIAPGSFPDPERKSTRRIALENHGIPIVGVVLRFSGLMKKFGAAVVSVKGIRTRGG